MPTVLGKRARSNSNSTVTSTSSGASSTSASPASTPTKTANKRQRTRLELVTDPSDANKENIPPSKLDEAPANAPADSATTSPSRVTRRSARETPSGLRTPRKFTREQSTPVIELGNLQLVTPPTTPSKPSSSQSSSLYAASRALLRTSTSAATFTGRENERKIINDFLESKERLCLYISGTPGTGKTALVNDTLKGVGKTVKGKYLNCMGMGVEEIKDLTCQTRDEEKDCEKMMVMVLDELEHLDSDSLALVLAVATTSFRIIGISNTHTLTSKSASSTLTLHFKPYTAQEMGDIISKRLTTLNLPDGIKFLVAPPALTFACKKVASQTGDIRACLSLVRGAVEQAEKDHVKKIAANTGDEPVPFLPISIAHVLAASKSVTTQAPGTVGVIRQLNLQARLVMLSLILSLRRLAASLPLVKNPNTTPSKSAAKAKTKAKTVETLSADMLFTFYSKLLDRDDAAFHAVSYSEFTDLMGLLETQGLVERGGATSTIGKGKTKKSDRGETIKLPSTSREEEIIKGLTECETGQMEGPAEREIRTMWVGETSKMKREVEDRDLVMKRRQNAFEHATEA